MIKANYLYRKKNNPEKTFLVTNIEFDLDKVKVVGYTNKGFRKYYDISYFKRNFIQEKELDYSNYKDNLLQYAEQVPEIKSVLEQICRRLHPGGYFHPGDIVFATQEIGWYLRGNPTKDDCLDSPYVIKDIIQVEESLTTYIVILEAQFNTRKSENLCIPMYQDRYSRNDAYACLRRYDMPY